MTQYSKTFHSHGSAIRGMASGVFFMAIFGTLWALTGIMGLQGWGVPLLLVVTAAICIALIISGGSLIKASGKIKDPVSETGQRIGKRMKFWFNIIFVTEGVAIAITIAVCNAIRQPELIPLIIAIIVGIHFFPLASLFRVRLYYYTGALLCLLAIITWLLVPQEVTIGGHRIHAYMSVIGIGSALTNWGTALAIWLVGKRLLSVR